VSTKPTSLFADPGFLSQEAQPDIVYSVRPFLPETDISLLHDWLNPEYGGVLPADGLTESWMSMMGSDSVRPFMGLLNGVPACQAEFYKVRQQELSLYYKDSPGDYGLHWRVAPGIGRDRMAGLLRTCLEYFFSFPEVGRILADADIADTWGNELFRKTGFLFLQKIALPYRPSNLYEKTRERLILEAPARVGGLLRN
jgi:hypothetical protein